MRKALWLLSIEEIPFSRSTLFNFQRACMKHIVVLKREIVPKPAEEPSSSILQSSDDPDTIWWQKAGSTKKN